jgi:hypothetical protein
MLNLESESMIVTSRRSLILGVTSLIVAPALVRATSLMQLRGENMDPLIIRYCNQKSVFNDKPPNCDIEQLWGALSMKEKVGYLNRFEPPGIKDWSIARKSELKPDIVL